MVAVPVKGSGTVSPREAEHADQAFGELKGIRRRVLPCGGAAYVGPDLAELEVVFLRREQAGNPGGR